MCSRKLLSARLFPALLCLLASVAPPPPFSCLSWNQAAASRLNTPDCDSWGSAAAHRLIRTPLDPATDSLLTPLTRHKGDVISGSSFPADLRGCRSAVESLHVDSNAPRLSLVSIPIQSRTSVESNSMGDHRHGNTARQSGINAFLKNGKKLFGWLLFFFSSSPSNPGYFHFFRPRNGLQNVPQPPELEPS